MIANPYRCPEGSPASIPKSVIEPSAKCICLSILGSTHFCVLEACSREVLAYRALYSIILCSLPAGLAFLLPRSIEQRTMSLVFSLATIILLEFVICFISIWLGGVVRVHNKEVENRESASPKKRIDLAECLNVARDWLRAQIGLLRSGLGV